jgi:L-malate glycosyltransferase
MKKKIFFAVPWLSRHDATGDYLLAQSKLFLDKGYAVYLCAEDVHPTVGVSCHDYAFLRDNASENDLLIYHYGIYDRGYDLITQSKPVRKILYYHNQTPPEYFDVYDGNTANALRLGLKQISTADRYFSKIIANSPYTISQQKSRHSLLNANWSWLPPVINDEIEFCRIWDQDRKYDFCVLGRIVPHKMVHKAIKLFGAYQKINPKAKMVIVGSGQGEYFDYCKSMIAESMNIDHFMNISDEARHKLLKSSKSLLNLSEHEGFSLPVIEALCAGCIPFHGSSVWLREMINVNDLSLAVDGDLQLGAFAANKILLDRGNECFKLAKENVQRYLPFFRSTYQYEMLA